MVGMCVCVCLGRGDDAMILKIRNQATLTAEFGIISCASSSSFAEYIALKFCCWNSLQGDLIIIYGAAYVGIESFSFDF